MFSSPLWQHPPFHQLSLSNALYSALQLLKALYIFYIISLFFKTCLNQLQELDAFISILGMRKYSPIPLLFLIRSSCQMGTFREYQLQVVFFKQWYGLLKPTYWVPTSILFLGPHSWHMEVPRLGVELELQPLNYTTGTAMPDLSHVYNLDLHYSSQQHWILHPLSEARDRIRILMDTSQIGFH